MLQTTVGTQAAPKPKVTPKQDELNKDISIKMEILVPLYRKRHLEQASELLYISATQDRQHGKT